MLTSPATGSFNLNSGHCIIIDKIELVKIQLPGQTNAKVADTINYKEEICNRLKAKN
jgi:hypothetical protein